MFPEKGSACDEALANAITTMVYVMIPIISMISIVAAIALLKLVFSGELILLLNKAS